ncbi:NAD(P)H-binding protein [Streptomyces capparidis]
MIAVTGATGNVGRHLVRQLAEAGVQVCALTRDPERARLPTGVRVARTGDLPLDGVAALFLNPAVLWGRDPGEFLERARWHGVRRIVTLSSAATLGGGGEDNPIGAHHLALEAAVEATGLQWTHLRPGAFAGNALNWAAQIREGDVVRGPYAEAQFAPVHEADIAAVAVRALLDEGLAGTAPVLSGPESLTHAEQVRIIGEALGRPLRYEEIGHDEALKAMTDGHLDTGMAESVLRMFRGMVGRPADVSPETERITGRPARTFARWAADNADAFR